MNPERKSKFKFIVYPGSHFDKHLKRVKKSIEKQDRKQMANLNNYCPVIEFPFQLIGIVKSQDVWLRLI